ncbi:MAG: PilZ domain-containing protein [Pseudobdellovibrionaceae bacterium]
MLKEFKATKKIPRLLLAHADTYFEAIPGVEVLWPDRSFSAVYDLSLSGLAVDAGAQVGSLKLDQVMELRLKVPGLAATLPFKVRMVRLKAPRYAGFVFENVGIENRLVLEQITKDKIVIDSLKDIPPQELPQDLQGQQWIHGAFDTNLILWFQPERLEVSKALVEYDNLIWMYDAGSVFLQKSLPNADENQNYLKSQELFVKTAVKVSMGASWMERLIRVIEAVNEKRAGELSGLLILLRSQRAH